MAEIVAKQERDEIYLIRLGTTGQKVEMGQVVDLARNIRYKPFSLRSIIARGYWMEYPNDKNLLRRLLAIPQI